MTENQSEKKTRQVRVRRRHDSVRNGFESQQGEKLYCASDQKRDNCGLGLGHDSVSMKGGEFVCLCGAGRKSQLRKKSKCSSGLWSPGVGYCLDDTSKYAHK